MEKVDAKDYLDNPDRNKIEKRLTYINVSVNI